MDKTVLNQEGIAFEILSESNRHHITSFRSDACKELELFLKENAWKEHNLDFSKTYLFFHNGCIVGYVTLLADKQSLEPKNHAHPLLTILGNKVDGGYTSIPALKIGRLCVIDDYNSQLHQARFCGLGKVIFASVLDYAIQLKSKVGCRVITTHAKKGTQDYKWYEKLGFVYSHDDEKTKEKLANENVEAIPMFYDINRVITMKSTQS